MPFYKHGKQMEPIDFEIFKEYMEGGDFKQGDYHRSFLAFIYWLGIRKWEALARKREDFTITEDIVFVNVPPLKKGMPRPPLEMDSDLPYVNLIIEQVLGTPVGSRVWSFGESTAWRIVKRVDERKYPHYFRLNRCTRMLDDPETTIPEVKSWFGWRSAETVSHYIGMSRRHIVKGRTRLRREIGEKGEK